MTDLKIDRVESPIGTIALVTNGGALCALDFAEREDEMLRKLACRFPGAVPREAEDPAGLATLLRAYLAGEIDALDALDEARVDPGGTPFQRRVWRELRRVPAGATRSYAEIARAIGAPTAARAVGAANGRNPIALAIPCHRVVTADRRLGGYAGGLERKRWLLAHEGAAAPA